MSKIGRNDPCPCGSGKKYKKCCRAKDEQQRSEGTKQEDIGALFEDLPSIEDRFEEPEVTEDAKESPGDDLEPYISKTIDKEMPEIGEQEQALVEAWRSEYDAIADDPDRILTHLHAFFQAHPHLVENLELDEALFELGAKLVRLDRAGDYIALLKHTARPFRRPTSRVLPTSIGTSSPTASLSRVGTPTSRAI
jgi:hypothetical protein